MEHDAVAHAVKAVHLEPDIRRTGVVAEVTVGAAATAVAIENAEMETPAGISQFHHCSSRDDVADVFETG